jgi:hypothetical protein
VSDPFPGLVLFALSSLLAYPNTSAIHSRRIASQCVHAQRFAHCQVEFLLRQDHQAILEVSECCKLEKERFVLDGQESQVVTGLAGRKAGEKAVAAW